ncbi:hypothetical protein DFH09DRAFT_1319493 [Mycena vulgaris]|nr:hypothetical protein DFH09DRAFT_1319493 [Mycena vulgaris]
MSSYRLESQAKMKQVQELSDPENPRVFHVTQYVLPTPLFSTCLPNNDTECPKCTRAHAVIRDIRWNNERLANQHDVFLAEVKENGFGVIAAGFGRGVLNLPPRIEGVNA